MNLAPVEEYFAEFLSAIESRSIVNGQYMTDPIIKPFNSFGDETLTQNMLKALYPDFNAGDTTSAKGKAVEHFRLHGITLPPNLLVIGTVNMDETTFSFSRKVLDRAMSIEMNEVNFDSFLQGTTDNDIFALVKDFKDEKFINPATSTPFTLSEYLIERNVQAKAVIPILGADDAEFAIKYLERINNLFEDTPFKLGYRAANEALLYVTASKEAGIISNVTALDDFTLMKILSRIEGDETKLKITDSDSDRKKLRLAAVDVISAQKYGDLSLLTALRNIIEDSLKEVHGEPDSNTDDNQPMQGTISTTSALRSIQKLDAMISQLKRDHFVSYWN